MFGSSLTGLGVIRSLGRLGIEAFSFTHPSELLVHSRWYKRLPESTQNSLRPEELADFLANLNLPRAVLMPCADDWLKAVSSLPVHLKERFPVSISPFCVINTLVDKWAFAQMLEREAVPHPKTTLLRSLEEMQGLPDSAYQGAFLKPLGSLEFGRKHNVKAFLIQDKHDALEVMAKGADFPIMLQDYIPGPPTNHYFIDGFVDRDRRISALFARRRLRMFPPLLGNSTLMETVPIGNVSQAVGSLERMWTAMPYRGIFSAEFKLDERDGLFKIIEVNARPWWFIEFATRCKVDVCLLAYYDALGKSVDSVNSYPVGRRCVYLPNDIKAYRKNPEAAGSLLGWLKSWIGAEGALFALDDPGPALTFLKKTVKRHVKKMLQK
jgi:predicted ATP-grasp superfamily ATP-dependent carboligase